MKIVVILVIILMKSINNININSNNIVYVIMW